MTNWRALQSPQDKTTKKHPVPHGVYLRYLSMGSFHADIRKDGRSRKKYKCTRDFGEAKKTS